MQASSLVHWSISCFLIAASAAAQSFNVYVSSLSTPPTPSDAYGAAAGQPGRWNAIDVTVANAPLSGLDGAITAVTLTRSNLLAIDFGFDNSLTLGDEGALMDDCESIGTVPADWVFGNLVPGTYVLYTYAWSSDNATYRTRVTAGVQDLPQDVGGAWPGHQQPGVTYAVHHFVISQGGSVTVGVVASPLFPVAGCLNGFQLVQLNTPAQAVCVGDGTATACPCGNVGGSGRGCGNSADASGARLMTSGFAQASGDTLVLTGSAMPDGPVVYVQGTLSLGSGSGTVFGDGLRCAGGVVVRLGVKANVGGTSQYPGVGDVPLALRGSVVVGSAYTYQAWYRDSAGFCTSATFNLTNGMQVVWNP